MTNIAACLVAVVPLLAADPRSAAAASDGSQPVSTALAPAATALLRQAEPAPPPSLPAPEEMSSLAQGAPPPPPQYTPPPPPPYPPPFPQRRSWYIGFGVGTGDGRIEDDIGSSSFGDYFGPGVSTTSYTLELQGGATLSPKLLLGGDWMLMGTSAEPDGVSASLVIQTLDAVVTYFPNERGFFVRGGAGFAAYSYDFSTVSNDFGGLSVLAGLGYAFWLGRSFNLTLNLDYSGQRYRTGGSSDPLAPTSSWFWTAYVGFVWY